MGHRGHLRVVPPPVYRKPTNEERAAYFARERTSVPQQIERESFFRWAWSWVAAGAWCAQFVATEAWKRLKGER